MGPTPACRTWRAAASIAAALLLASPSAALAHDPGLSVLDIRLESGRVIAALALAAADARIPLELQSIDLALDGVPLQGRVEQRGRDEKNGVRLVLAFERQSGDRLTVRTLVPGQLGSGHRQLVTVHSRDGRVVAQRMLGGGDEELSVDLSATDVGASWSDFIVLGVHHILGGYDHLLFLAALLLGVRQLRSVVGTVTAFTIAHSLTLAVAALGLFELSPSIVEPAIAASIVYVGLENLLRRDVESRWKLTFAFGLIHGFGFASALRELGLGTRMMEIVTALGSFNTGVEIGQIAVVALFWPLLQLINARPQMRLRLAPICSLAIVTAGSYWLVSRIL
jgi:hydrogenase/urease accessory protein HupE